MTDLDLESVKRVVRACRIAKDALMEISMCSDHVASQTALRGLEEVAAEMCPPESNVRALRPLELVR